MLAQFWRCLWNFQAHLHPSHVDFSGLPARSLTKAYGDHPALATGSMLEDTWRVDNWRYMMDLTLKPACEHTKKKEINVLGDLGFEPKSQCFARFPQPLNQHVHIVIKIKSNNYI